MSSNVNYLKVICRLEHVFMLCGYTIGGDIDFALDLINTFETGDYHALMICGHCCIEDNLIYNVAPSTLRKVNKFLRIPSSFLKSDLKNWNHYCVNKKNHGHSKRISLYAPESTPASNCKLISSFKNVKNHPYKFIIKAVDAEGVKANRLTSRFAPCALRFKKFLVKFICI